uniref:PNPLA domain-containing protein n=1 Tax=Rhodopseudomonas palustris (strain BisA53) TaxID=316055 RepID=Q07PN7_RHOP5
MQLIGVAALTFDSVLPTRKQAGMPTSKLPYVKADQIEELIANEKEEIAAHRDRGGRSDWTGIALSGGGIRSAIFCLGALQALAEKNILKNFDYMSSVSGGGYIASALQWFWRTENSTGTVKDDFPFGTARTLRCGDTERDQRLGYLRTHGRYLTPGDGLTIWSMTAVVIRTLFLNLAIWLPLGAVLLWGLISIGQLLDIWVTWLPNFYSPIQVKWQCGSACDKTWPVETVFGISTAFALLSSGVFAVWALAFSLDTAISPGRDIDPRSKIKRIFLVVVLSILAAALIGVTYFLRTHVNIGMFLTGLLVVADAAAVVYLIVRILQIRGADASENYRWRRAFEISAGWAFPWIAILFAVGTLPVVPYLIINEGGTVLKSVAAVVAALSGIVSAVAGHGAQTQNKPPSDATRWILMAASAVFIYTLGCIGYTAAQLINGPALLVGDDTANQDVLSGVLLALAGLALILGLKTNINYVGLHRFYRDRLMEAFMPSRTAIQHNSIERSPAADKLSISELWPPGRKANGALRQIPYPIVNTNAVFVNDDDRVIVTRGGDNFIASPLYVGCRATGWEDAKRHIAKHGPLSLASAMAASGAALNSNSAYVGAGVTRDRLLSIVLMLLNLRLGMWVGRPCASDKVGRHAIPNHFYPGFRYGVTLSGYRSDSAFVELSDGGHFDNLGIYELVRRKSAVIVVLDGEQDASTSMPALYSVVQRIEEDFKARIGLEGSLDNLVAKSHAGYPDGARFVEKPFFAAPINYEDGSTGVLIYVKLALAAEAGFTAKGYRAQYPDFPHQSTANQFFVPQQIEAYRDVGYVNMQNAIDGLALDRSFVATDILQKWSASRQNP